MDDEKDRGSDRNKDDADERREKNGRKADSKSGDVREEESDHKTSKDLKGAPAGKQSSDKRKDDFLQRSGEKKDAGSQRVKNNVRVGVMVVAITAFFIAGLYIVGDKENIFGKTFYLTAHFRDVGGLTEGNNVRFGGIDVGTVESVDVVGDTSMLVLMRIDDNYRRFIHRSSVAMIATDGVIGNRVVTISSSGVPGEPVTDGTTITSLNAVSMEETTRTLSATNQNLKIITDNVKSMTRKLDSSALWMVLADTAVAENIRRASYDLSESMKSLSNSFLIKGFDRKKEKK